MKTQRFLASSVLAALCALFLLFGSQPLRVAAKAPAYQLIGLGNYTLPQYSRALNNNGQVLLNAANYRAVVWNKGKLMHLGLPTGYNGFTGNAINDAGAVVGTATSSGGAQEAFKWDNKSFTDLGTLGHYNNIYVSYANSINKKGEAVGVSTTDTPHTQAFLYQNGAMAELPYLNLPSPENCDPYNCGSQPYDISDSEYIVGTSASNQEEPGPLGGCCVDHATVWYPDVNHQEQPHALDTTSQEDSVAYQVNSGGASVGIRFDVGLNVVRPLLWASPTTPDTGQDLLNGNGTYDHGEALSINGSGDVVGYVGNSSSDVAFIYHGGTLTDLNTLIDPNLGWTLYEAVGINDAGQIVGSGNNGYFLLNPIVSGGADLQITNQGQLNGDHVAYTFTLTNNGPHIAHQVVVTDKIHKLLHYQSATPSAGTCQIQGTKLTCNIPAISPGDVVTIAVDTLAVNNTSKVRNKAVATTSDSDPNHANNIGRSLVDLSGGGGGGTADPQGDE